MENKTYYKIFGLIILSLMTLPLNVLLLFGPIFVFTTPLIFFLIIISILGTTPNYYYRFLIGFLLEFGLITGRLAMLQDLPFHQYFFPLTIGIIGFFLIVISLWQHLFKVKLSAEVNVLLNLIAIFGLILALSVVYGIFGYVHHYHGEFSVYPSE